MASYFSKISNSVSSLYNTVTGTKDDYYEDNVKVIKNFPNNPSAMLKSFKGKLDRADGSFNRLYGYVRGSVLSDTVKVIQETAVKSLEKLRESEVKATKKLDEGNIRQLNDTFLTELGLLEGIAKIYQVYKNRYQKDPNRKEALDKLETLYRSTKQSVEQSYEEYQNIIEASKEKKIDLTQSIIQPRITQKTKQQALSSLSAYCGVYCPEISHIEAAKMMHQGETLLRQIMKGNKKNDKPTEKDLANLTWHLMNLALKKKQGFNEGTFVLEDPNQHLFNYLKKGSYSRSSSHYAGRASKTQFGTDVINGKMPASKRTLLFEMVQNPNIGGMPEKVIFIKPENFSADKSKPYDLLMHGYEFAQAQYNKIFFPGSDDLPNMRKERVPVKILKEFHTLVDDQKLDLEETNKVKSDAKKYGIAFMKHYVDSNKIKAESFDKMIAELDHPTLRTGREVYLTSEDLLEK